MKSKRFTRKRKKRGGMFPVTRRRKSPTTEFDFPPPNENESLKQEVNTLTAKVDQLLKQEVNTLTAKVDQLLKLVKTIHERTNNTHDFIDKLLVEQEHARKRLITKR
jgi:hypothetical protein